ncbi:hypothetical protein AXI59_07600 [Bacillus nakamurai]|uniref:Uncharacterized protein n=1 Tax=Bacillus nakamurai TaxID=1793963 RepID=A0A150F7L5_9BACI|nr:hypothetical protein AXI58_00655 [Bacillus nakamurai]KXZ23850.1 hypothetical protein AXI59_07600 [Bacillus nakamurai]
MEENQDALLYYQLLEFRHEIMLSYMESKKIDDLNSAYETIKEIEEQGQLTGMLEYYYLARRKIKNGEIINEDQPNSIDSNGVK